MSEEKDMEVILPTRTLTEEDLADIKGILSNIKTGTQISDCRFVGVEFDKKVVSTIEVIAQGLVENAKALGELASVFRATNVTVETVLKITPPKEV